VLLLCIANVASADDLTRAFAGTYEISNVVEDGSHVQLTLTLTFNNFSNEDIKGGIVALMNSQPTPVLIGSFNAIKDLAHQRRATISHAFTLDASEYASWQHGHAPVLQFLVPSGDTAVAVSIQAHQVMTPKTTN
jgi:hypothetical protein